jgi:hypothetical protein
MPDARRRTSKERVEEDINRLSLLLESGMMDL